MVAVRVLERDVDVAAGTLAALAPNGDAAALEEVADGEELVDMANFHGDMR